MKLCVANLARTDMTPRPAEVSVVARPKLDSIFEIEEDEAPTTVYAARRPLPKLKTRRTKDAALAAI